MNAPPRPQPSIASPYRWFGGCGGGCPAGAVVNLRALCALAVGSVAKMDSARAVVFFFLRVWWCCDAVGSGPRPRPSKCWQSRGVWAAFAARASVCTFRTAWLSGICSFWLWPPGRFLFWCANTPVRVFRFSPVRETRPERDIVNEPLPGAFAVPPLVGIP